MPLFPFYDGIDAFSLDLYRHRYIVDTRHTHTQNTFFFIEFKLRKYTSRWILFIDCSWIFPKSILIWNLICKEVSLISRNLHSNRSMHTWKSSCHSIHFIRIRILSRESVQILTRSNGEFELGIECSRVFQCIVERGLMPIVDAVSLNPIQSYVIRSNELKLIFISQNNDRIKHSLLLLLLLLLHRSTIQYLHRNDCYA